MAWTYFTAPLAAGEELTGDMRAELVVALDERYKAIDASWGVVEAAGVAASALDTLLCTYTTSTGTVTGSLAAAIRAVAGRFWSPAPIEGGTAAQDHFTAVGNEVFAAALTALGENPANAATWLATPLRTRVATNMYREAIRQLRWFDYRFGSVPVGNLRLKQGSGVGGGLAAAVADYAAAAEVVSPGVNPQLALAALSAQVSSDSYSLGAGRTLDNPLLSNTTFPAPIPATTPWTSGWQLAAQAGYQVSGHLPNPAAPTFTARVSVGGVVADLPVLSEISPPEHLRPWVIGTGTSMATGSMLASVEPVGYASGSPLWGAMDAAVVYPGPPGDQKIGQVELNHCYLALKPTFERP